MITVYAHTLCTPIVAAPAAAFIVLSAVTVDELIKNKPK
jgi:hypothetical protein